MITSFQNDCIAALAHIDAMKANHQTGYLKVNIVEAIRNEHGIVTELVCDWTVTSKGELQRTPYSAPDALIDSPMVAA
jgi:hypothetical protein